MVKKIITCPFCFEKFRGRNLEYRCLNPHCSGKKPDSIFAGYRNLNTPPVMGHVYKPAKKGRFQIQTPVIACDHCAQNAYKKLCPNCHFELSHDVGLVDDYIIAIIGGPDTGKGHYIATLIHSLEQAVGTNFNFGLLMLGDETRNRFDQYYRNPLFLKRELLQPTRSATVDIQVKHPLMFRLSFGLGRRLKALNLSFFDTAGEDMIDIDAMDAEARYITSADGIIFLLDPLQIDAVRNMVDQNILPQRDPRANPDYIVERLRELFEKRQGLAPSIKVKTPVAFTFSKIDALIPIIDASTALRQTGPHFGVFDEADSQSVSTEIWNYIQTWMGSGFSNRVTAAFANFRYFGVSSIGHTPTNNNLLEAISPIRVEDPFLWILSKLKLIKAK